MNGRFFKKATGSTLVIFLILSLIPFGLILRSIEYIKVPSSSELSVGFIEYLDDPSKFSYGYIPPPFDMNHLKRIIPNKYMKDDSLPSQFDWRTQNGVTPVKNQQTCGTCWIFGTTSVLESKALINEGILYDFSEQSIALCSDKSWTYLFDGSNDPCMAGGWSYLAAETFMRKGAKLETCLPYDVSSLKCDGSCLCDNCSPVKRVSGYRLVTDDKSNIDMIKQAIYNNGPVTGSFYYESKYLYNDQTFGYFYDANTTNSPNHLISIVGWNNEVPHKNTPGTGAWIVKNSWGSTWGNFGYFYLAYNSSNLEEISYLLYENYLPSETLYAWDESTMLGGMGYKDYDAWMASVYTAQTSGQLTKVEFWVPSANASYNLYVYDGKFGSNILAESSGSLQETGYYSFPLQNSVILTQGQIFTVAVKLTTPGYIYPVPVEFSLGTIAQPTIQTGATFIRNNDSDEWKDTSINGRNVCLRAIVNRSPTITISQPNGLETLKAASIYSIKWVPLFLTKGKIKILFSSDAGSSWSTVETDLPLSQTTYSWTIPSGINSEYCLVKVGNYDTVTGDWITFDDSDYPFTVTTQTKFFQTTSPMGTDIFSPTDIIRVTWDVEGFTGTEGKVRVLFYNGSTWEIIASNLDLADGSYDISLSTKIIVDPLRCRVRAGIYDPETGAWLPWTEGSYSGQYYDEIGHFWVISPPPTKYFKTTYPYDNSIFSPADTIHVTWDVEGFTGTEGKVRVLFYNGSTWEIIASNLDLTDGSYDISLSTKIIVDPLRCRVRAGIYDPETGAWLPWTEGSYSGQYYDEIGHFWVISP